MGERMVTSSTAPFSKRLSFDALYLGFLLKEMVPKSVVIDVPSESMSSLYSF